MKAFAGLARLIVAITLSLVGQANLAFADADDESPGEFPLPDVIPLPADAVQRLRAIVANDPEAAALARELETDARPHLGAGATPLAVIHYEGLVNTDPRRVASVAKLKQTGHASRLVRYWQATNSAEAAATLKRWIVAWFDTYEITGNDVNENKLFPLLVAYYYFRDSFTPDQREALDGFVAKLGAAHARAVQETERFTNRYTKHVRLAAICGMILQKTEWIDTARAGVRRFVEESLHANGESDDLRRRDTLTYHNSALRPAIQLAMLAGDEGRALYEWENSRGGSLKRSTRYVVPYALGEKVHEEWKDTTIDLDRRRAAAGLEKYQAGRLYDPKQALPLMEQAAFFDESLKAVVKHLTGSGARRFPTWQTLVNASVSPE